MTSALTVGLLAGGGVVTIADWVTVGRSSRRGELVAKPLTLALLIAAAATADLGVEKPWVIVALALGLAGDVGLLFTSGDRLDGWFLGGLGAFLLGHVAWIIAFLGRGLHPAQAIAGVLVVAGVAGLTLGPVLRAVAREAGRSLAVVVAGYTLVLGAMAVLAIATGLIAVAVGGVSFLVSDAVLARDRFVRPVRRGHLVVMVTYHLAQFLLLIGLLRGGA